MHKTILHLFLFSLLFTQTLLAKNETTSVEEARKVLPSQCIFYFKMFLNAKGAKAFAYAMDSSSKVTCRFSSNYKKQKEASKAALESCQTSSLEKEILSDCKLYNSNTPHKKTKKALSFEDKYLISLQKIKKENNETNNSKNKKTLTQKTASDTENLYALPKSCRMFYQIYKEAPKHKAFSLAVDSKKKYACKFSAKNKTAARAKKIALSSCNKARKIRGIKNPCKLFSLDNRKLKIVLRKKEIVPDKPKPASEQPKTTNEQPKPASEQPKPASEQPKITSEQKHKKSIQKRKPLKKEVKKRKIKPSALQKAILNTDLKKIKTLIKKGADINTEASDKSRALFVAVAQGDIKFSKELLEKGADPFFKKSDGNNLLVAAIMSGNNALLRLILEYGVDPNIGCEEGNTPLHFALMMFDDKMMKTLYEFHAIDELTNDKGKSVKSLAKELNIDLESIKRQTP